MEKPSQEPLKTSGCYAPGNTGKKSNQRREPRQEGGGRREDDTRRMEGRGRERQGEIGERATIDARKRRLATKGTQETDLIYTKTKIHRRPT